MDKVLINDVTVRDGNQSLLATRMEHEDILSILRELDNVGLHSIEVWGGATFDVAMRFFDRSPWQNLREMKKVAPKTPFSMLLRGQNIVGYKHYDNDTLERFIKLSIKNGIDIIRIFDALNDIDNVKYSIQFTKKYGGHAQGAISYTVSPVHNIEYYVNYTRQLVELGIDSICIKDMAGILLPQVAHDLIKALKNEFDIPINLHSHSTTGLSSLVFDQAIKAGVDIVDGCISPFSNGTSHIALETLQEIISLNGKTNNITINDLEKVYEVANSIAVKYIDNNGYSARNLVINPKILTYQVPGGMLSNLLSQLKDQGAVEKYDEVLKEIPSVRKDLGYPPLVTPLSQMVGTQAVLNVLTNERYKMIPNEIKNYAMGLYGKFPGPVDQNIITKILSDSEFKEKKHISEIPSVFKESELELKKQLNREPLEEEVISYILFPQNFKFEPELKPEIKSNEVIEFKIFEKGSK